jgi:hypothetical protein
MTNLDRLKLSLSNKQYFSDTEYTTLLAESGLTASDTYSTTNKPEIIKTEIEVFNMLLGDISKYTSVTTEFTTVTQAYNNIKDRINSLTNELNSLSAYSDDEHRSVFSKMYFN